MSYVSDLGKPNALLSRLSIQSINHSISLLFFRSAFFWFCNDERGKVKQLNPEYGVGDIAKELGKKWSDVDPSVKSKYEAMAENDKKRYERVSERAIQSPYHLITRVECDSISYCVYLHTKTYIWIVALVRVRA